HVVVASVRAAPAAPWRAGPRPGGPWPRRGRGAGVRDLGDRPYSRHAQPRGIACRICPLLSALRPPPDADHAAARLRGGPSDAAIGRLGRGVDELVAFHLSIQPDAAAGGVHSLRNDTRRAPDRAANRRRDRGGRPCSASEPGVRSGETVLRAERSLHALNAAFRGIDVRSAANRPSPPFMPPQRCSRSENKRKKSVGSTKTWTRTVDHSRRRRKHMSVRRASLPGLDRQSIILTEKIDARAISALTKAIRPDAYARPCEPRRQRGSSAAALASVPLSRSGVAASPIACTSALAKQL